MRAETEAQVAELRAAVASKKAAVVEMLARHVANVPAPRKHEGLPGAK